MNYEWKKALDETRTSLKWILKYHSEISNRKIADTKENLETLKNLEEWDFNREHSLTELREFFEEKVCPGLLHWQHPRFAAWFPSNANAASFLAEVLVAGVGVQAMNWQSAPAVTRLEEFVLKILAQEMGLGEHFQGTFNEGASFGTTTALCVAREKSVDFLGLKKGYSSLPPMRVYASEETHFSIDKATRVLGIGDENLIRIPVSQLEDQILEDKAMGYKPIAHVSTLGTTSSLKIDPVDQVQEICERHNLWHHVDAAFLGSALILEEYQKLFKGLTKVDSLVVNPHKWLGTHFPCSILYFKHAPAYKKILSLNPEYLGASQDKKNDHKDFNLGLGRRFNGLKLFFVLSQNGFQGLKEMLRAHIELGAYFRTMLKDSQCFKILNDSPFPVICFQWQPKELSNLEEINTLNRKLLDAINTRADTYLSGTMLDGHFCLRFVAAQNKMDRYHIKHCWDTILQASIEISKQLPG